MWKHTGSAWHGSCYFMWLNGYHRYLANENFEKGEGMDIHMITPSLQMRTLSHSGRKGVAQHHTARKISQDLAPLS